MLMRILRLWMAAALLAGALPSALAQPPRGWEPPRYHQAAGPALGVLVEELPFGRLDSLGLSYGLQVSDVAPGSPAEEGGLRSGDILLKVDDQPVFSVARLRWLVRRGAEDGEVTVTYHRDGESATTEIELAKPPAHPMPYGHGPWGHGPAAYLGVQLQALTPGLREAFEVPEDTGALVSEVLDDSPAYEAGLQAGDVIIRMDRKTIRAVTDVQRVVDYVGPGEPVELEIIRDRASKVLTVELAEREASRDYPHWHGWRGPGPSRGELPFFTDPDWWEGMEDFLEDWREYWEEHRDQWEKYRDRHRGQDWSGSL